MKEKLYTMLRVKSYIRLSHTEKVLMWFFDDVSHEAYIRNLIELRDSGFIEEKDCNNALYSRKRELTDRGYKYLEEQKELYLKKLQKKFLKWFVVTLSTSFVLYVASLVWKYLLDG